jgi:cyclopropane-fatty-acyl-phospholipid synthase
MGLGPLKGLLTRLVRSGDLTIMDSSGTSHRFGDGSGKAVRIRLTDRRIAWALALNAELAAGEGYMADRIRFEAGDILDLLEIVTSNLAWHPDNPLRKALSERPMWFTRFQQWNARRSAKRNVAHHYDLSGKLYDLFLDADKQYSCAYFTDPANSLEQAQADKKAHIAAKLLLGPGQSVLDIGCGWGGLGLYLNQVSGAAVTGVTLSEEQLAVARQRAADGGVADQVRFELTDYRDVTGRFDRVVSVGMFEHVGLPFYRQFFETVRDRLSDDGVALIHTIGRADGPGVTDPWTRKYIFPGGYAPALSEMMPAIERAGLYVTDIEVLRLHYMHTLQHWYDRSGAVQSEIEALYDARFYRLWRYYLASALTAFRHLGHVVFQVQLARRVDTVPLTRDYIGETEKNLRTLGQ